MIKKLVTCYLAPQMPEALQCQLQESFLDEGFILDKRIGVGQPKRIENAKILVANTAMDTDKIKIYGARVRVDSMAKVILTYQSLQSDLSRLFACQACYLGIDTDKIRMYDVRERVLTL